MENLYLAGALHSLIAAKCPILGVSIGDPSDKATWTIQFSPDATRAQKAAAAAVLASIDPALGPPPRAADVNAERDLRVAAGFKYAGAVFQSRADDQQNISGAGVLATLAVINGAQPGNLRWHGGSADFAWIAADNSLMSMDAQTVIDFGKTAAAWKSVHIFAGRALKDLDPIPADFAADGHWPARALAPTAARRRARKNRRARLVRRRKKRRA